MSFILGERSLLASVAIALSVKLFFRFNGSYLGHITSRQRNSDVLTSDCVFQLSWFK